MRFRSLIGAILGFACSFSASAQSHFDVLLGNKIDGFAPIYIYVSTGASQMGLAVATNTTLTVPTNSTLAEICVETAAVRYRDDGTAATSTLGIPVASGTCFSYSGPLASLSFTAVSGSPTLDVSYYKAN